MYFTEWYQMEKCADVDLSNIYFKYFLLFSKYYILEMYFTEWYRMVKCVNVDLYNINLKYYHINTLDIYLYIKFMG